MGCDYNRDVAGAPWPKDGRLEEAWQHRYTRGESRAEVYPAPTSFVYV